MRQFVLYRYSILCVFALVLALTILVAAFVESERAHRLTAEYGPMENATVVLYLAVIGCLLVGGRTEDARFRYHSALIVSLMAMRELDLHHAFTTGSVLKLSYYLRSDAPPVEKFVAGTIVVLCLYAMVRYIPNLRRLRAALTEHSAHGYSTVAVLILIPLTQLIDAAPRILRESFDVTLGFQTRTTFFVFEETLEMGIPVLVLWTILQYRLSRPAPGMIRGQA